MAIPLLSKLFSKSPKTEPMQMPMPVTYYQPIPQTDRRPDADIMDMLLENKHVPKEILDEHWCYDLKTIATGKRSVLEAGWRERQFRNYAMEQENWNPRYKDNPDLKMELRRLEISVGDALEKSIDGHFLSAITNPINITETRQAIATGQIQGEKKKGGLFSFLGL